MVALEQEGAGGEVGSEGETLLVDAVGEGGEAVG